MIRTRVKSYLAVVIMLFGIAVEGSAEWQFVAPMPHGRYSNDATIGPDGKIYVMGGFVWYLHDGRYSNIVYDPQTDAWAVLTPVPGWVRGNERLFMVLDPVTDTWSWVEKIEGKKDLPCSVRVRRLPLSPLWIEKYMRSGEPTWGLIKAGKC